MLGAGCGDEKPQPAATKLAPQPGGQQIRVRHILIQYAGGTETPQKVVRSKAAADSLARDLHTRITKGEDFAELARQYSDDASAGRRRRNRAVAAGRRPAGLRARRFGSGARRDIGCLREPLRLPHRAKRLGTAEDRIACQHILIRYHGATGAPDSLLRGRAEALRQIEKIAAEVQNPDVSFRVAAAQYSEDPMTAGERRLSGRDRARQDGEAVRGRGVRAPRRPDSPASSRPLRLPHHQAHQAGDHPGGANPGHPRQQRWRRCGRGARRWDEALQRAMDVLFRARKGESFEALAEEFSDDPMTAKKGGRLPPLLYGQTVPEFEDAAFRLKPGRSRTSSRRSSASTSLRDLQ